MAVFRLNPIAPICAHCFKSSWCASIAQLAEHLPRKQKVSSSILDGGLPAGRWSRGMILASGARGRGFDSRTAPHLLDVLSFFCYDVRFFCFFFLSLGSLAEIPFSFAWMPERSKGADLRSAGCNVRVGSNPTSGSNFYSTRLFFESSRNFCRPVKCVSALMWESRHSSQPPWPNG